LQSYELSRLNLSANLRSEMAQLLDQWVEESASAMLARWLILRQERGGGNTCELCGAPQKPRPAESVSDNFPTGGVFPRRNL
jgi:hypothetical protein